MYYVKIGGLLYLRCPGFKEKRGAEQRPGLLDSHNIQRYLQNLQKPVSNNPILRGVPATSSRATSPLVVTLGTSGV